MSKTDLAVAPLLPIIHAQSARADETRSVDPQVIEAIKSNEVMGFTASVNLGGQAHSVAGIGLELEAVAGACASTAWVLWNHLSTFHLFAGLMGPGNAEFLSKIVEMGEWVCFPAGASTGVHGDLEGDQYYLSGKAAFGSGARYAEWVGVSFVVEEDRTKPRFSLLPIAQDSISIDADWRAMSLRASATDTVYYDRAGVPLARVVPFLFRYREVFRDPDHPMIDPRYREDWVALSDLWLGLMAVGLVQAAFDDVADGIKERIAIGGVKMADRATVHVNLGHAQTSIAAARDTAMAALNETDARIEKKVIPDESNYLRQTGASMTALKLCDEAMRLLVRVMGGNGLREGPAFARRFRDFQAMPLHINAHQDRISEQVGRSVLGLPTENPF